MQFAGDARALELSQIGGLLNHSAANHAGETCAHGINRLSLYQRGDHLANLGHDLVGTQGFQIHLWLARLREHPHSPELRALHDSRPKMARGQDSDPAPHGPS